MRKRWSLRYKQLVLVIADGLGSDAKAYRGFNVSELMPYE